MKELSFFDTNVLVYAEDADEPIKRQRAIELVTAAMHDGTGVISTQVLQEFFAVCTRKLGIKPETVQRRMQLLTTLNVIQITTDDTLDAVDLVRLHKLSYWDALIINAARKAGCSTLLSEDMNHGQSISGVKIRNPFIGAVHER
ncbi:PIN domain-containing protein [Marinihelvus fidelis]|nr:PIN domain-containing protein [Marinihelvus fidelis]